MLHTLITIHLMAYAASFVSRLLFTAGLLRNTSPDRSGLVEYFNAIKLQSLLSDICLCIALISGVILFSISDLYFDNQHPAFKLKAISVSLLLIDICAFQYAIRHARYGESGMWYTISQLNLIAIILMTTIVYLSTATS